MVEDPVETVRKMIRYLDSAFIGYCHLNIIKPPQGMVWGTRNDREVHHAHEMNLEANFDEIGIRSTMHDSAIPVIVKHEWLDDSIDLPMQIASMNILDVPELTLSMEG